ncbi:VWA domain-containing protein [Nostoc sp. UIC 10607]|uniref:VWA domain-containing protein n=1 Tax=Nostoc sp. UIC 10607 TaxID=3045935 RepID=UPI0039A21D34
MDVNDLPLLELFTKLREAGLPLGIDEYQLVLQAMQAGFGINDQAALKRLCQTLWIKSAEEMELFEYHFEQVMSSKTVLATSAMTTRQRQLSQITRYLAVAGACIIGAGIVWGITSRNQNQTTKDLAIPSQTPGLINTTPTLGNNPNATLAPQINQTQNESNWKAIAAFITLGFQVAGVGLASGTVLTTIYTIIRWLTQRLSKQTANDDSSLLQATTDSDISSSLTQVIEDEVQVAQAVLQATSRNDQTSYNQFILSFDYLPITQRQMKQMWRHLRRMIREGVPTELDVEATIKQIGHQGTFLKPVIVPRRVNRTQLLLLIDQDGSMIPFHSLSQRLVETALRGGRLGRSNIYYFHNCPVEYLYQDPNHQQAELIENVLVQLRQERTVVLIFSDAGAARGGFNPERIDLTGAFVKQLKQYVRYIAWLNPMPRSRWLGTTAGEIAHLIPMYEVNRRGMQNAIDVLRGRSPNFQERIK